jgi:hypothetical protein
MRPLQRGAEHFHTSPESCTASQQVEDSIIQKCNQHTSVPMTWAEDLSLLGRELRGNSRCGLVWRCLSGDSWAVWYGRFLVWPRGSLRPHILPMPCPGPAHASLASDERNKLQGPARARKNPPGARVEPVTSHRCSRIAGVVDAGSSVN